MDVLLEVKDLTKTYPGFKLDHVSFTVPKGCIMGLIGENGAGKSTTIKGILGLLRPEEGRAAFWGQTLTEAPALKEDIGVVFDGLNFYETLTPAKVGNILRAAYRQWDDGLYKQYIQRFDLPLDKEIKGLSKGMKAKLGITAALAHRPRFLILDEATSGLDPMVREELLEVFADFAAQDGHAVLISSHIVSDLEKICDYVAFLEKGRLVLCEEKDVLLDRYGILKCGREDLNRVDPAALHGVRLGQYGAEALVERDRAPRDMVVDRATLEDIILHLAKEEEQ